MHKALKWIGIGLIGTLLYLWIWSLLFGFFYPKNSVALDPFYAFKTLFYLLNISDLNHSKITWILLLTGLMPLGMGLIIFIGQIQHRNRMQLYGNAHWANWFEIYQMGLFKKEGLLIGKKYGQFLRAKLASHALVFAPSRSGKGVSQVIPNALTFKGSLLVIDVKKEIFEITSGFRKKCGQSVFLFDPTNPEGKTHYWNPLDLVNTDQHQCIADIQLVVQLLIPNPSIHSENSMWVEEARSLSVGLLLWLMESDRPFTLGELAQIIKGTPDFTEFLEEVVLENNLHPIAHRNLNNFIQKAEKEQSGVKSTLTAKLNLFDDPRIVAATSISDFDIKQIRQRPMSIYLGIPTHEIERLAPLMNLFIQLFLKYMTEKLPEKNEPLKVLAILDEFCALGRMDMLKKGFGFLAGYNIHLMAIIQNIGQFFELYGGRDQCDTFFQNTDYKISYRQNTKTDQEFISQQLGNKTVKNRNISYQAGVSKFNQSQSESVISRPLLTPDQVRNLSHAKGIALINGKPAVQFNKIIYYKDPIFKQRILPPVEIKPIEIKPFEKEIVHPKETPSLTEDEIDQIVDEVENGS